MKSGKVWGETKLLHANGVLEFHRIETVKGGVCSKHKHQFKWNGFFVESGKLLIRVWKDDYDLIDETILEPGDFTQVKPGEFHQFEALEDTVAFELYWAEFNHNDIVRETVGYKDNLKITHTDNLFSNMTDPQPISIEPGDGYGESKITLEKKTLNERYKGTRNEWRSSLD